MALALGLLAPAPCAAELAKLRGHLSVGYATLFVDDAPGGSISMAAGLSYPIGPRWQVGADMGYSLLGNRMVEEGTAIGELDYSMFEALALLHWSPTWSGPLGIISFGPGVFAARAELNSSAPTYFDDLAIEETAAGAGLSLTFMQRRPAPVRLGLEAGMRYVFLPNDDWTLASVRVSAHY